MVTVLYFVSCALRHSAIAPCNPIPQNNRPTLNAISPTAEPFGDESMTARLTRQQINTVRWLIISFFRHSFFSEYLLPFLVSRPSFPSFDAVS